MPNSTIPYTKFSGGEPKGKLRIEALAQTPDGDMIPLPVVVDDAGNKPQQHRLAGAGRTEQHEGFAIGHGQRQIVEDGLALVALDDVSEFEAGHVYPFTAPSERPSTR